MLFNVSKFLVLCSVIILSSGCISFVKKEQGYSRVSRTANKAVTHHRVKVGETLYSIAFQYGRDHRDLIRWNQIRRPYTIYPNQKLRVVPINSDKKKLANNRVRIEPQKVIKSRKIPQKTRTNYVSNSKLKWIWPTKGKVVSTFSIRDPGRRGIDIVGRKGQAINAAATGRVVYSGSGLRGYGNLIILKHNDAYFSAYAHTENVVVKENEKVKLGQRIADMGNTSSEKTKLHFEIRRNGKPVNPLNSLPRRR